MLALAKLREFFTRQPRSLLSDPWILLPIIAMALTLPALGPRSAGAADEAIVRADWIYEKAPFPECHASTLAETKEGIVVAFFGGTYEKHPDVGVWVARQQGPQGTGRSWSTPVEVANGLESDGKRHPCWNPVLINMGDQGLWLFYKVGPSPESWWGMLTISKDGGKTWGKPERLPDGILGPIKNKPVLLADQRLLCGSSTEHDGWKVHMEWMSIPSRQWASTRPLGLGGARGAIQPTILRYGEGTEAKLQILCRSRGDGRILESWSRDAGRTWTEFAATTLPNPNSGIDGVTLRDGKQLLVYNHTASGRSPLNVAWSIDGHQWHAGATLEREPGEYSYPAVIQTADGHVHITYTWKRQRVRHLELDPTKLPMRPIVNGQWPE